MQEHSLSQRAVAETLGTALLVLVGPGSVVATLVLAGKSTPAVSGADLLGISFAFGFIIAAMVYAIGKVSGCHINPAVTFALAATKRFPWREVPSYWAAQIAGGLAGAFAMWGSFGTTPGRERWRSSRAAAPDTSRCTVVSSAPACSMPPVPARCSRHRSRTRC